VPVVLHEGDVKTLPREVFAHVEQMGAPRLVEYWEQDPCATPRPDVQTASSIATGGVYHAMAVSDPSLGVTIEAKFAVGEYQIVILSAKDSTGLDTWLHANKYNIPAGAEPLLRPYVESGSKFFVAKVDPSKLQLEAGRARLSPLRFHYDAEDFALPIRLGLANSAGTQDLIVNILAPAQRYRVANYDNAMIPTNLDVRDSVRDRFGAFYAALFDATLAAHPHAIVTEYAWQASSCDPCPGPQLSPGEMQTLGADVLDGDRGEVKPHAAFDFVLTRLHARYGKELANDLVFERAEPIAGGREAYGASQQDQTACAAPQNNFQARYAIRHAWTGPVKCQHPVRGRWAGPWPDAAREPAIAQGSARPAVDLAHAPRGDIDLATALVQGVPALGGAAASAANQAATQEPRTPEPTGHAAPAPKRGCGCNSSDPAGLTVALFALARPKRRRGRWRRT
jgi:hypothetical protein